jgi:hypothetical protein
MEDLFESVCKLFCTKFNDGLRAVAQYYKFHFVLIMYINIHDRAVHV